MNIAGPRSLRDADAIADRRELLRTAATALPLSDWVDGLIALRQQRSQPAEIPYIDPLDAGTCARVLIILEAPGPRTNAFNTVPGSGFISSDNDDATAENLWHARREAGLIDGVLIWNAVPWYLGPTKRKPLVAEKREGGGILRELIQQLPELDTVVPLGDHAKETWRRFTRPNIGIPIRTIESFHSGSQAMNQPGLRPHLHAALARAASGWTSADAGNANGGLELESSGSPTSRWYLDGRGDRIDIPGGA